MKVILSFILLVLTLSVYSQENENDSASYDISPIKKLKSSNDIMISYADMNIAIYQSPLVTDYVTNWNPSHSNEIRSSQSYYEDFYFKNLATYSPNLPVSKNESLGTVSLSRLDTSYTYCTLKNGAYSIHYYKNNVKTTILKGSPKEHYIHPFITRDGSRIFFSSNLDGSNKDYNIYYINRVGDKWSSPVKLHDNINTSANEVFPTWYNDTLYYSSDAAGNLDLFYSSLSSQYNSSKKMGSPFNTEQDDFFLHKLNEKVSIITSDRILNMDQPYLIKEKLKGSQEKNTLQGFIACDGNRISDVELKLISQWGVELDVDISDEEGNFVFSTYKSLNNYRIKLDKKDPRTRDCAVIYLTDENGNVLQKIVLNSEGVFKFEIIDTDKIDNLNLLSLEDESLLKVNLNGQIYEDAPGDVGEGEPVKIVDLNDNLLALAYTKEDGSFEFENLSPYKDYRFNFDEIKRKIQLRIYKNGEVIRVPVQDEIATYQRIDEENAIELIDENGANIAIEASEYFEISDILYEFASDKLTERSKIQLDKLARFIFNNDEITVELTSHTDSRGNADFNLELSQLRVNSAIEYLVSKGVRRNRLQGYGMGERKPINNCVDGVECSEEDHALNRRTEIRIIAP